jgi:hypothetical protein
MILRGIEIDKTKLYSKDELLTHLKENGESDKALSSVRDAYQEAFGNELMWRYPISDGLHAGTMIVTVKEGFISLPFNCMDETEYEFFELDRAAMFNEDALQCFITDWKDFSDDLLGALNDMLAIVKKM